VVLLGAEELAEGEVDITREEISLAKKKMGKRVPWQKL